MVNHIQIGSLNKSSKNRRVLHTFRFFIIGRIFISKLWIGFPYPFQHDLKRPHTLHG